MTTVARTLIDLADVLETQALRRVITEAEYLNRFDLTAINAVVDSKSGPQKRHAHWIEGYETDFLWRHANLVVELDGLTAHRTTAAMKGDRRRDRILWNAGFRTMRLTEDDLDEPDAVLADLAQAGVNVSSRSRASSKLPRRSRTSSARVR